VLFIIIQYAPERVVKRKKGGGWFSWLTGGDDDDLDVDLEPEQTSECTLSLLTPLTYLKQKCSTRY